MFTIRDGKIFKVNEIITITEEEIEEDFMNNLLKEKGWNKEDSIPEIGEVYRLLSKIGLDEVVLEKIAEEKPEVYETIYENAEKSLAHLNEEEDHFHYEHENGCRTSEILDIEMAIAWYWKKYWRKIRKFWTITCENWRCGKSLAFPDDTTSGKCPCGAKYEVFSDRATAESMMERYRNAKFHVCPKRLCDERFIIWILPS